MHLWTPLPRIAGLGFALTSLGHRPNVWKCARSQEPPPVNPGFPSRPECWVQRQPTADTNIFGHQAKQSFSNPRDDFLDRVGGCQGTVATLA